MVSLPNLLFKINKVREWYESETISVNKNGINGTIIRVRTGLFNDTTIMVNKSGIIGTTTVI